MGGKRFNRHLRGHLFTQRVVHTWNELLEEAVAIATFRQVLE